MPAIDPTTTVHELITAHPHLIEDLPAAYPRFAPLRNPAARAVMAKVATLDRAASVAGVPVAELIADVEEMIRRRSSAPITFHGVRPERDRAAQVAALKEVILGLHAGGSVEDARKRFQDVAGAATPQEIAEMEQELIRDGVPVEEIQRLCDLHVGVVRQGLDDQPLPEAPPGHPVHTYMAENRLIETFANRWVEVCKRADPSTIEALRAALDDLAKVDIHYTRKEHQLFPALEAQGFTGPSKVMWGIHDQIRAQIKDIRRALADGNPERATTNGIELARQITEMVYKEERILFPTALALISDDEWAEIRAGDAAIGFIVEPQAGWPPRTDTQGTERPVPARGEISLSTGSLTPEQLDRLLVSLPVEISFVDDQDIVRFYSDHQDRTFPRSPGDIGRAVQNCHPPKSLHMVEAILQAFRSGTRDSARFWIRMHERMIMISYHAVRDRDGRYLGCMEVTQDITDIQSLTGERRLLEWE